MNIKNLALIVLSVSMLGCYSAPKQVSTPRQVLTPEISWDGNIDIVYASYDIVEGLENNLSQPISQDDPIVVASFVDVSDLRKSSAFGRIMAEQVGSRFAQKGYKVIEMKLRQNSVFVEENKGEFLLSRNIKDISVAHKASVVVVGTYTYAEGSENVYVSARMVNPVDSIVMSSYDRKLIFKNYNYKPDKYKDNHNELKQLMQ